MLVPGDLYVDANATTPLLPSVRAAIETLLAQRFVNPQSAHHAGERSRRTLEAARQEVATAIGAQPDELVFTSGATEANHLALFGLVAPPFSGKHLVISAIEHASLLAAAELLEKLGAAVTRVAPEPDGRVHADALLAVIRPDTKLVALMSANNETGVLQPVTELAAPLAARGIDFHVDAVQSFGREPLDVARLSAASIALSAHKIGGPPGIGALFVRRGHRLVPLIGGGRQERGRRGGTHALIQVVGFAAAAREVAIDRANSASRSADRTARDVFESALLAERPTTRVVGHGVARLANTSSVTLPGSDAAALLEQLSRTGVHASAGSACEAGSTEPSHVLRAIGLSAADARATLRFSFLEAATAADGEAAARALLRAIGCPQVVTDRPRRSTAT